MTLKESLYQAHQILLTNNIEYPSLESELLLRQATKLNRVQLYLELEHELNPEYEEALWRMLGRRLKGEPTAYIKGHREFYGYDFYVNHNVLIPRPESELLVEKLLDLAQNYRAPVITDIGTGCGAIAISLSLKLTQTKIYATDISLPALEVALANCQKYDVVDRICLLHGDMLEPLPEPADIIAANMPYVKQSEINIESFEPVLALNGGIDGLEKIRHLCHQAASKLRPRGCLIMEIGQGQKRAVTTLLHSLYPSAGIEIFPDLGGIDRVVTLTLSE